MKKHIRIAALVMVLALLLAGCGGKNSNNTSNNGFDRSAGLDENGYWKGIKASEYVDIPDFTKVEVKQSAVDEEKTWFLTNYPDTENVTDAAVKDGDTVNIDYVGKVDGVAFDGGSTMGRVKSPSAIAFTRLEAFTTLRATKIPRKKEIKVATIPVLIDI